MSFTIVERGPEGKQVPIKPPMIPGGKDKGFMRFHYPILSVHVIGPKDDYQTNRWVIVWSNHHQRGGQTRNGKTIAYRDMPHDRGGPQKSESPGKFTITRKEARPEMEYVKDGNRVMLKKTAAAPAGVKIIDYVEMQLKWGTSCEAGVFTYGPDHPMNWVDEKTEYAAMDNVEAELIRLFGEKKAEEILLLFVEHETYQEFVETETMRLAA